MRYALAAIAASVLVLGAGCATGRETGTGGEGAQDRITVTIENDLQPPTAVTVSIVDQLGTRRLLGDVGATDTRSFSFEPIALSGNYRLSARTTFGRELVSDSVNVLPGEEVRWQLFGNVLVR